MGTRDHALSLRHTSKPSTLGILMSRITISGTVYEADGTTPVANADVWAEQGGNEGGGTLTKQDGTYKIKGLASGDYLVFAEAPGFAGEIYPGTQDENAATPVTVTAGANTPVIHFTLDLGGSISGIVYEADGTTPVGNTLVVAQQFGSGGPDMESGIDGFAQADGTYTITGVVPSDYMVFAIAMGQNLSLEIYNDTSDPAAATSVTVVAGADTGAINFTLEQGGTISGTVYEADGTTPIMGMIVVTVDPPLE